MMLGGRIAALLALAQGILAQHVVEFGLNRGLLGVTVGTPKHLSRRETYSGNLLNNITGGAYYIDALIGTPAQRVSMVLDTGSSDAWVVGAKADLCVQKKLQDYYQQSCHDTYDPAKSSSYKLISSGKFDIIYLDGGGAAGDYISDDFTFAGTTVKSLQMGYANQTSRGTGILGIGYNTSVQADKPYPNIIDQLQTQGKIATKAYSLYLNDRRTDKGSILFGGIDKGKFIGPLKVLPILKPNATATPSSFEVELSGMNMQNAGDSNISIGPPPSDKPLPAILDSGSTFSYLPDEMAQKVFKELGVVIDDRLTQLALIDCKYLTSDPELTLSFILGDATITVPVWEMVLDLILDDFKDQIALYIPFTEVCVFGLQSNTGFLSDDDDDNEDDEDDKDEEEPAEFALLGETFLRSAYVVFDLAHHQIGIAQANLNSTDVDIVEFKSEDKSIPTLTGVAAQQTTNPPRDTDANGGTHTVTVTATPNIAGHALPMGGGGDAIAVLIITSIFTLVGGALMAF